MATRKKASDASMSFGAPAPRFYWKMRFGQGRLNANEVGQRLMALKERYGNLTAEIALRDAADPKSPMHKGLTWDDAEAAHERRLDQMRQMIAAIAVRFVYDEKQVNVRAFHAVVVRDKRTYEDIGTVLDNDAMFEQIKNEALISMGAFKRKFEMLEELGAVFAAMEVAQAKLKHTAKKKATRKRREPAS